MPNSHHIAAQTLIWLAALTVPVQGVPTASCGCGNREACCGTIERSACCCCTEARVREGRCCCTGKRLVSVGSPCCVSHRASASSCKFCQTASDCTCEEACQCGTNRQNVPATPPAGNSVVEKLASDFVSAPAFATACPLQVTRQHDDSSSALDGLAEVDRCASLCRFTL